jgi:uncharacterized membrane protein
MAANRVSGEVDSSPAAALPAAAIGGPDDTTRRTAAALPIRLGGIAGLVAVVMALVAGVLADARPSTPGAILAALPLLLLILWLEAIRAFQATTLGRLGSIGARVAMAGVATVGALNLLRALVSAEATASLGRLLDSNAVGLAMAAALSLLVWGILALGTASLRTGMLPRGSVVLWMVGLAANVVTSWLPAALAGMAGVAWLSVALLRPRASVGAARVVGESPPTQAGGRLLPLDALRGTIMALMAIDHASYFVRRWHPFETWDQPLPDYPNLAAMLTRLATHPCAPGFFFLMGAGMLLFLRARREAGWSDRRIAIHLALRGLLFIALEQLVVDVVSSGRMVPLDFSILAGLGGVMLLGVLFVRLSPRTQAIAGASIILVMQVLPGWMLNADLGFLAPIRLLLLPGSVGPAFVLYPPIPWLGISLLGMAFAGALLADPKRTYRLALVGGLLCMAFFTLLRELGGFGNLRMPPGTTLIDFFNVVKYPPSLSFLLLSLGFDLILLNLFSHAARFLSSVVRPLVTLGQAALYFFLSHWFVYAVLGGAFFPTPGGLPATYLVWIVGLGALYPICRAYEAFKHTMPVASIWRMI